MESVKKTGWNLMEEVRRLPLFDECPTPCHWVVMNIIAWNCRGALKPEFRNHVRELVQNHNPAMLIVMETRVSGDRAKEITDRLPFDEAIHTKTIGFAGGLWLLWNTDRVAVSLLATTEQEIHVSVKVRPSDTQCFLSAVYASPKFNERCILWKNLVNVASLHSSPWIIAGDFNKVLADNDKFGGRTVNANRSLLFKDCLDSCNMVDLGFSGPRFTWSNCRGIRRLIQERLDRFFVNPDWCTLYPNARVSHLTHVHSDHCPVLLDFEPSADSSLNKPFKFQSF
ncbi:uncharacterized protein LOC115966748 [Quercus lobata]|uniref:uncharacterized protein LOC115966748 n=1 Tax=Quercus lobata TaxID=97700 RepID=UPI001244D088|nr:uncharacterized protein LOC115966748 [Quercus lobata]